MRSQLPSQDTPKTLKLRPKTHAQKIVINEAEAATIAIKDTPKTLTIAVVNTPKTLIMRQKLCRKPYIK